MAAAAALASVGAAVPHLPGIGYGNYLLVWGSIHQWGFAWRDGILTHPRWRPYALAAAGAALLAGLVTSGAIPRSPSYWPGSPGSSENSPGATEVERPRSDPYLWWFGFEGEPGRAGLRRAGGG